MYLLLFRTLKYAIGTTKVHCVSVTCCVRVQPVHCTQRCARGLWMNNCCIHRISMYTCTYVLTNNVLDSIILCVHIDVIHILYRVASGHIIVNKYADSNYCLKRGRYA